VLLNLLTNWKVLAMTTTVFVVWNALRDRVSVDDLGDIVATSTLYLVPYLSFE